MHEIEVPMNKTTMSGKKIVNKCMKLRYLQNKIEQNVPRGSLWKSPDSIILAPTHSSLTPGLDLNRPDWTGPNGIYNA